MASEPTNLQDYRAPASAPLEQSVFDCEAGWIELRRYGDGEHHIAWCVRIKTKVPGLYNRQDYREGEDRDLCVIKVPIHHKKFTQLNAKARQRALEILRAWRGGSTSKGDGEDND